MIFVCVGSREYQFDRLLKEIDYLVEKGDIASPVFAQIGGSGYIPKNYSYERFLDRERFGQLQDEAELIISHAGTGALIGALKKGKKVIAVPRLARYGEHIDDHQTQIAGVLAEEGYLLQVVDISELCGTIRSIQTNQRHVKAYDKPSMVLPIISDYLERVMQSC